MSTLEDRLATGRRIAALSAVRVPDKPHILSVEATRTLAQCQVCGNILSLNVTRGHIETWRDPVTKPVIQRVMPHLTPGERELLMSGVCDTCFDRMWGDE